MGEDIPVSTNAYRTLAKAEPMKKRRRTETASAIDSIQSMPTEIFKNQGGGWERKNLYLAGEQVKSLDVLSKGINLKNLESEAKNGSRLHGTYLRYRMYMCMQY